MKVIVLGAGRVGELIARDLAGTGRFELMVVDRSRAAADRLADVPGLVARAADLADSGDVARTVAGFDLAVGAVPGPIGYRTLRSVIDAGVSIVDISFFEEEPWPLHLLAVERGVTAVMDCGIAPGCSNLVLGRAEASWERVEAFRCYVGGLPVARHWPFQYAAPFSPIDVIAEYTRPARVVEGGEVVSWPPLTGLEALDFDGVGTLEAFNTDGLRTLLETSKVPDMFEKTMRYPGHCEQMSMLRDAGFFGDRPIAVGGVEVRPIDVTSELLIPMWQLRPQDEDLTAMRIEIEGVVEGERVLRRWELLDRYDRDLRATSMARTTGYTCTAMVHAIADGLFSEHGLSPPEIVGRDRRCHDFIFDHLARRGVVFQVTEELL